MQFLSNKTYLAMNAALFIAYNGSEATPVAGSEIINYCGLNKRALEPVLQKLSGAGVIISTKGSKGGYHMPSPEKTTLKDIADIFTSSITPEKHDFAGYDDILMPFIQSGYDQWCASLGNVTFQSLRDSAQKPSVKIPVLNYAI